MSAFIVEQNHIRFLIAAALATVWGDDAFRWRHNGIMHKLDTGDAERAREVGQMLWTENVRSVQYRYPNDALNELPGVEGEAPYVYEHREWMDASKLTPAQVFSSCHCYEYQACEHPGWDASEAKAFVAAVREATERRVTQGTGTVWGAPDDKNAPPVVRRATGHGQFRV